MSEADRELLLDVLIGLERWTTQTIEIVASVGPDRFRSDVIARLALAKAVEQCGEICGRILRRHARFADAHPELELRSAQAMRNRLVHGYDGADLDILWFTATVSIPKMRDQVRSVIASAGGP